MSAADVPRQFEWLVRAPKENVKAQVEAAAEAVGLLLTLDPDTHTPGWEEGPTGETIFFGTFSGSLRGVVSGSDIPSTEIAQVKVRGASDSGSTLKVLETPNCNDSSEATEQALAHWVRFEQELRSRFSRVRMALEGTRCTGAYSSCQEFKAGSLGDGLSDNWGYLEREPRIPLSYVASMFTT